MILVAKDETVMPGRVPGIHGLKNKNARTMSARAYCGFVDGRAKPGHDGLVVSMLGAGR